MHILKFGGTSVGSPEIIKKVIKIIKETEKKEGRIAVVVSAFSKVTDKLIEVGTLAAKGDKNYKKIFEEIKERHLSAVRELVSRQKPEKTLKNVRDVMEELEDLLHGVFLIKEISKRTLDLIMSFGERLSAYIISEAMDVEFLDARKIVKTDEDFGSAKVNFSKTNENIREYFKNHKKLQIITGFIGSTDNNETSTLGRGGSDYSAAIFGAALNVKEIEIWTDVDGIMTADPRKVKKAFPIDNISYVEAMEMSHFGAKVIHPPTMQPALDKNIPIRIKNTMNPKFPGSVISKKNDSKFPIKGISSISDIALLLVQGSGMVGVPGVSKRLFGALSREKINIILITQASSEHSICFAIEPKSAEKAKQLIEEEFDLEIKNNQIDPITIEKDFSILAIVGENMRHTKGIAGKVFSALAKNGINISAIAQGSSELNISVVIAKTDETKALNAIHDAFFLSGTKTLNIFLVGSGLIGSTLLKQLHAQSNFLRKNQSMEIKVVAITNSRKMIFNSEGLNITDWQKELDQGQKMDFEKFFNQMIDLNLPNSIFVDCTANENIANNYEKILTKSISIVTPNKKANSGTFKIYENLKKAAKKYNVKFLYETNVGAGLPVIGTLNDLLLSGEKILKIEAVLSGTLSYIFNSLDGKKSFSEVVKEAREKGYTEPDPRDDLNGLDVARKILILGRETGLPLEMKDVEIENLVPEDCRQTKSIDEFFKNLKKHDAEFEKNRLKAAKNHKKLCYIAMLEHDKAKINLKEIDQNHPFYSLSGSDNIISFTTNHYLNRPLVIKGPGAGADVTAAGVFADIIRIANYLS